MIDAHLYGSKFSYLIQKIAQSYMASSHSNNTNYDNNRCSIIWNSVDKSCTLNRLHICGRIRSHQRVPLEII